MGHFLEAKSCYEMNLIVLYKLLKTYPENSNYQSYTAGTFNNLGTLLVDMGRIGDFLLFSGLLFANHAKQ
jgi:hypothetical protein